MELTPRGRRHLQETKYFLKWIIYACFIGVVVGTVAVAFHYGIDWATELRMHEPNIVFLLPAGGVAIVLIYRICKLEVRRAEYAYLR